MQYTAVYCTGTMGYPGGGAQQCLEWHSGPRGSQPQWPVAEKGLKGPISRIKESLNTAHWSFYRLLIIFKYGSLLLLPVILTLLRALRARLKGGSGLLRALRARL